MQWKNTIDTVVKVETALAKGQWQIGDAIKKDARDGAVTNEEIPVKAFDECGAKLVSMGYQNYSGRYLNRLYDTARAFPPDERNPAYTFTVHYEAGTPANLKLLVTALRKFKKPITSDNVHDLRVRWAEEARDERQKVADAAAKKKADVKAKKKKATEKILAAKDDDAKAQAKVEREEAIREIEELTAVIKQNSGTPALNTDLDVNVEDVDSLRRWASYMRIEVHISKMRKTALDTLEEITTIANMLSERERQAVEAGCTEILEILEQIRTAADRKPGLKSIKGGKA